MARPGLSIMVSWGKEPFSANAIREGTRLSPDMMANPLSSAKLNTWIGRASSSEREEASPNFVVKLLSIVRCDVLDSVSAVSMSVNRPRRSCLASSIVITLLSEDTTGVWRNSSSEEQDAISNAIASVRNDFRELL